MLFRSVSGWVGVCVVKYIVIACLSPLVSECVSVCVSVCVCMSAGSKRAGRPVRGGGRDMMNKQAEASHKERLSVPSLQNSLGLSWRAGTFGASV